MRANYVRAFYLPRHYPAPSSYMKLGWLWDYETRLPPHIKDASSCECGREKNSEDLESLFCEGSKDVLHCLELQQLSDKVLEVSKPVCCPSCNEGFADDTYCGLHIKSVHESEQAGPIKTVISNVDVRKLNVKQLHYIILCKTTLY